ncbi:MAG TPA: NBR1-Ig-like domain-containing protein [Anaerolineales bacterium]|nr:NBR1-Ig-like domain-containing protein [Anaerolineales bacterium]
MNFRRFIVPIALAVLLVVQFLPGMAFAPRPAAAATACDWAQFVSDVTVPDGTGFAPGTTFVKTWRLKNIGTCTWTTSYTVVFANGSLMGAPASVNLPASVAPGATVDISVNMTAPSAPGTYVGYWKLRNASGGIFGVGPADNGLFFVQINVSASYATGYDFVANYCSATWTSGAGTLPCPGTDGDANGFVLKADTPQLENGSIDSTPGLVINPQKVAGGYIQAVYPAFTVQAGDRFQTIVNCAYNATGCYVNFRLNYQIDSGPIKNFWTFNERYDGLYYRANIDLSALAGQNVKFILYMADVSGHGTPSGDRALWGETKIARVVSGPTPTGGPTPTIPSYSTCDRGYFLADVTIPDGTTVASGSPFTKTWRIQNVGTCTWTTSYALVFTFGDALGSTPVIPLTSSVAPGQSVDLSVNMTAPSIPGHYRSYWRMRNASGAQFGVGTGLITFFADINVTTSYGVAYDFAANACSAAWSSGSGALPCPGSDGDIHGFVLNLGSPKLEDGTTGPNGLLTFPQNVTDGYIQGVYPAFTVQSGDHFQSIINCAFGSTGCYVTFQLNYQIGSGTVQNLKTFREKLDGMYYNLDVNLSSLAGQNVKFILKVLATGSPAGDRAVWSGPRIGRSGAATLVPTATGATATTGPTPTPTMTATAISGDTVSVYFQDINRYTAATLPYEVAVSRPASATLSDPDTVLTQLFLGPTPTEQASGLRLVLSGTTGYSTLTINGDVASVYLTGGCASGGATYTIANLITANLKQFAGINYVKIYDPSGHTETPTGESDSIPTCLEP